MVDSEHRTAALLEEEAAADMEAVMVKLQDEQSQSERKELKKNLKNYYCEEQEASHNISAC